MSSWNSERKILRISKLDGQRLHFGTASNWLVSKMAEANLVIHGGWIIKDRFGRSPRLVPKGHGDVVIALMRHRFDASPAAPASAIRRERRRRRANTTTKGIA